MEEARLERTEYGLGPASEGWFVVNVRDAEWETNEDGAAACMFESGAVSFPEIGYRLAVLQPGTTVGFYHAESNQEDFLVLGGECVLLIEGEERRLKPWDFVHCPPGTKHVFVGAGDAPCVIFMTGARTAAFPPRGAAKNVPCWRLSASRVEGPEGLCPLASGEALARAGDEAWPPPGGAEHRRVRCAL